MFIGKLSIPNLFRYSFSRSRWRPILVTQSTISAADIAITAITTNKEQPTPIQVLAVFSIGGFFIDRGL